MKYTVRFLVAMQLMWNAALRLLPSVSTLMTHLLTFEECTVEVAVGLRCVAPITGFKPK